jgi:PadR family transcriptional regulator, regulatory protein AphA
MSLKHAILGFLSYQPMSGYDLKKAFDNSVRHFWPADQSQIYRTLNQLDRETLVEKEIIPREDRLDLKIYHITPAGSAEIHRWLTMPLPDGDDREPLLVQIFFGGLITDEEMAALLDHQIAQVQERLQVYETIYRAGLERLEGFDQPRFGFFTILTLEYGIRSNQVALDWLIETRRRVAEQNYTPADFSDLFRGSNPVGGERRP